MAVGLLLVESNGNVSAFNEYIMGYLEDDGFGDVFRHYLKANVAEKSEGLVINSEDNDNLDGLRGLNDMEKIGIIVSVLIASTFILLLLYYCDKWKGRKNVDTIAKEQ